MTPIVSSLELHAPNQSGWHSDGVCWVAWALHINVLKVLPLHNSKRHIVALHFNFISRVHGP